MNTRRALGLLVCGVLLLASEHTPSAPRPDPRLRAVIYNSDEIYRLAAYVGYQIDLEFESGEHFIGLGAGDVEGVTFAAEGNHLFLKPKAANVRTNLTVLTNRHSYHFDYTTSALAPDPDGADVLYVLRFLYADQAPLGVRSAAAAVDSAAAVARPRNDNYWYCGRAELAPLAAWDDGVQTHLRFDSRRELPAVFVRNDDGSESLLNFHIANNELIIHRLARRFVVRRGGLVGCIVNQSFEGSGQTLNSGTVAPDIERSTRGAPDGAAR